VWRHALLAITEFVVTLPKKNIQYLDACQYDFVIMVKGMAYRLR
jgi:hypothetical protein